MNDSVHKLVLHDITAKRLQQFSKRPSHALLIAGPAGIGKKSLARELAASIMQVPVTTLAAQSYLRIINIPDKESSISIGAIRTFEHFLTLKVPGNIPRVVIITDANTLTSEAQNALLKTLEEPVANTFLILLSPSDQALLPTIRSRVQVLQMQKPKQPALAEHFKQLGYSDTAIRQAHLISGGLPGLMTALLTDDASHPLVEAVQVARNIVQSSPFDRLSMVDKLSKDKLLSMNTLLLLQQMAHISLANSSNPKQWQKVLQQSYRTIDQLQASGQPKLTLTNLMLSL